MNDQSTFVSDDATRDAMIHATKSASSQVPARKLWQLGERFPEISGIDKCVVPAMWGYDSAYPGVPERRATFVQEKAFLEEFLYWLNDRDEHMLVLTGPTGCGKTERVLDFFSRLNVRVERVAGHRDLKTWHLLGFNTMVDGKTTFVPGPLYRAMKLGIPFVLDEAFRIGSAITSKFHTIRDRGEIFVEETGKVLTAKTGFKFIATANQAGYGDMTGLYGGDAEQDLAFLNGLSSIECDYPSPEIEARIVQATLEESHPNFKTDSSLDWFAPAFVSVAKRCRFLFVGNDDNSETTDRLEVAFSTRTLIKWAKAWVAFRGSDSTVHPLYRSLDFVAMRKACKASREAVDRIVAAEFQIQRSDPA